MEVLAADLDEFETALEAVDLEDLSMEEAETFALETQKLAKRIGRAQHRPGYKEA